MVGKIIDIRPIIKKGRLQIAAKIYSKRRGCVDALMPGREIAALIPRSILIGEETNASRELLKHIIPIINRLVMGRHVLIKRGNKANYFLFLPWKPITFLN